MSCPSLRGALQAFVAPSKPASEGSLYSDPVSQASQQSIREFELIVECPDADPLVEPVRPVVFIDGRVREEAAHAVHRKARIPQEKPIGRTRLHVRDDGQGSPERRYNLLNLTL